MPAWIIRAREPGLEVFEAHAIVAVNCWTRFSCAGLLADDIFRREPHTEQWHGAPGSQRRWARELETFVHSVLPGDTVVAVEEARLPVLVGEVAGDYRYDEGILSDHPHLRDVNWFGRQPPGSWRRSDRSSGLYATISPAIRQGD